jgi:hypothetical protein
MGVWIRKVVPKRRLVVGSGCHQSWSQAAELLEKLDDRLWASALERLGRHRQSSILCQDRHHFLEIALLERVHETVDDMRLLPRSRQGNAGGVTLRVEAGARSIESTVH